MATLRIQTRAGSWQGTTEQAEIETNMDTTSLLETIFRRFNRVDQHDCDLLDRIGYDLPSLSVGDKIWLRGIGGWEVAPADFDPTYAGETW